MVRLPGRAMDEHSDAAPAAMEPREARPPGGLCASDLDALDAAAARLGAVDFGGLRGLALRELAVLA